MPQLTAPETGDTRDDPREVLRAVLTDESTLVRAVASGRRRGAEPPAYKRVELRYVDLKAGRRLQVTEYDERQAHVRNTEDPVGAADELLAAAYGNWRVETTGETLQLRYTKKGRPLLHREPADRVQDTGHDHVKSRVLDPAAAFLRVLGISDRHGVVKPSRQAKYRQIEEFAKILAVAVDEAVTAGRLPEDRPLRVVDLGCGNAYLTLAAYHLLTARGYDVRMTGVDHDPQARVRNTGRVAELGWSDHLSFVDATIAGAEVGDPPDLVLALHACDTATDDALARAVEWEAPLVLAAPCCHHDLQKQLKTADPPSPYALMTRYGIVRERFADVLTDALRASVLRQAGYRVEVMEFVDSAHTPRNLLLRAARTGVTGATTDPAAAKAARAAKAEYDELTAAWHVTPRLATLVHRPGEAR